MLEDIATLTGGKAIFEDVGMKLEKMVLDDLGRAKKVMIDKDNTTIVEGAGQPAAIKAGSNRFVFRSKRPPLITTKRNFKSDWQNWQERCCDQGRCSHRDGDEGEEGAG